METATQTNEQTLYERVGGSRGISALVNDIVEAHMNNPEIKARFLPYRDTPDKLNIVKAHLCVFLAAGCGGPEQYTGRDMRTAHRGMNISEAEYVAALDDILMVLDKHNIDQQTKNELLAIAYSLKGEIVRL